MNVARKILIVDDDPDIRLITELALQLDAGWKVQSAASAQEACDLLASGWQADMILADVSMPGGSGLDLLRHVRADHAARTLPVVLFTASIRQQDLKRFEAAGAAGVIAKPFDPLTLADELRRLLAAQGG